MCARNIHIKNHSGEVSGGNEDMLLETGSKASLVEWQWIWLNCVPIFGEGEFVRYETRHPAETSRQSTDGAACVLTTWGKV